MDNNIDLQQERVERARAGLEEIMKEIEGRRTINVIILGGDFNIRVGELGSVNEAGIVRRLKDKIIGEMEVGIS